MLRAELSGADRRIWDLHAGGMSVPDIAAKVDAEEARVRGVVVGVWYDDKLAAKAAKRKRAA